MQTKDITNIPYLTVKLNGKNYVDFTTMLEVYFNGHKRSTIARKLKKLCETVDVPFIIYKHKHYYEESWASQILKHFYEYQLM